MSDATFDKWRSKYGGMEVSEAKRLKSLEEENGKLKRLLADAMLDVSTLREMLGKNWTVLSTRLAVTLKAGSAGSSGSRALGVR